MQRQGRRSSQETAVQPRGRSWFRLKGYSNSVFELFYGTKTPNKWKMLAFFIPEKTP